MKKSNQGGFIQIALLVLVALIILKYAYSIDVVGFFTTGTFKEILDKVYAWGLKGWSKYSDVIIAIWNFAINLIKELIAKI